MKREATRQMCLAYRRAFGRTALQKLLDKFGIDEGLSALDQQDKHKALVAALQGELPPDAIAHARAVADSPPSDNGDVDNDGSAPKTLADIHDAAYAKWNSAGKRGAE